jgi:hypothetical protein
MIRQHRFLRCSNFSATDNAKSASNALLIQQQCQKQLRARNVYIWCKPFIIGSIKPKFEQNWMNLKITQQIHVPGICCLLVAMMDLEWTDYLQLDNEGVRLL